MPSLDRACPATAGEARAEPDSPSRSFADRRDLGGELVDVFAPGYEKETKRDEKIPLSFQSGALGQELFQEQPGRTGQGNAKVGQDEIRSLTEKRKKPEDQKRELIVTQDEARRL